MKGKILPWIIIIAVACGAFYAYNVIKNRKPYDEKAFAAGNGRLEATEINVAAKLSGRLDERSAEEGQMVKKGDVIAKMQTNVLEAELAQANANVKKAEADKLAADASVEVSKSNVDAQKAAVARAETVRDAAKKTYERNKQLVGGGSVSQQVFENAERSYLTSEADLVTEQAKLKQMEAALLKAQADVESKIANIQAEKANAARTQADIDDSYLKAPVDARVQYKVAEVGEVLSAGGAVVNLVNLHDVYITFFLPERITGQVEVGADVRILLDAMKEFAVPAKVTFVSATAQFTPKTVETESERQKMMFRVKAHVNAEILDFLEKEGSLGYIKTGLPGVAYVRLDPNAQWPDFLKSYKEKNNDAK